MTTEDNHRSHLTQSEKTQFCSICKQPVVYSSRYPDYVCENCTKLACDDKEQPVMFYNSTHSGHGCKGSYRLNDIDYNSNLCFIKRIPCRADEAYFGGIVIRPIE
jgi:hypothetical protein